MAFGVDRDAIRRRGCYYTWKIGKAPDFVLETRTFKNDRRFDGGFGRRLCSALGVAEYWIVNITRADMDKKGLSGNRLVDGRHEEIALTTDAAGGVRGYSSTLGLSLCRDDVGLRVYDPTDESCALNVAEERAARLAAEAENQRLRERLRRLQSQS